MTQQPTAAHRPRRPAFAAALMLLSLLAGALLVELLLRALGYAPRPRPSADEPRFTVVSDAKLYAPDEAAGFRGAPGEFEIVYKSGLRFHLRQGPDGLRRTRPAPGSTEAAVDSAARTALDSSPRAAPDSLLRATADGPGAPPQIWILGDSFTHGWSVNDEDTYCWRVQQALPGFDVRNFGVGGYGTLQCLLRFEEELARGVKPAVVVLSYASFHDERNTWNRSWSRALRPKNPELARAVPRAIDSKEHGFRVVYERPSYRPFPLVHRSALATLAEDLFDRVEDRLVRHTRAVGLAILRRFHERCTQEGVAFVLAGIHADPATRRTLQACGELGIDTVDIAVDLQQEGYRNLPHDGHPSARAHAEYARRLLPHLRAVLGLAP